MHYPDILIWNFKLPRLSGKKNNQMIYYENLHIILVEVLA